MSAATLLGTEVPLVSAPMAGGPSTTALVTAVAEAGAFGFLAGGYVPVGRLGADIETVRAAGYPFGVNLFAPGLDTVDAAAFAAYARRLAPDAAVHGIELDPVAINDDDDWDAKLALLLERPVPVVSFTFPLPSSRDIAALRRSGSIVLASVTTMQEALTAEERAVNSLVVQGPNAGGHSAPGTPRGTLPKVRPPPSSPRSRTRRGCP